MYGNNKYKANIYIQNKVEKLFFMRNIYVREIKNNLSGRNDNIKLEILRYFTVYLLSPG